MKIKTRDGDIIEIESLKKISLNKNDVLFVEIGAATALPQSQATQILQMARSTLAAAFPNNHVIVTTPTTRVSIISNP